MRYDAPPRAAAGAREGFYRRFPHIVKEFIPSHLIPVIPTAGGEASIGAAHAADRVRQRGAAVRDLRVSTAGARVRVHATMRKRCAGLGDTPTPFISRTNPVHSTRTLALSPYPLAIGLDNVKRFDGLHMPSCKGFLLLLCLLGSGGRGSGHRWDEKPGGECGKGNGAIVGGQGVSGTTDLLSNRVWTGFMGVEMEEPVSGNKPDRELGPA